jgi:hypothetical protein
MLLSSICRDQVSVMLVLLCLPGLFALMKRFELVKQHKGTGKGFPLRLGSGAEGAENHSTYTKWEGGAGHDGRKTEDTANVETQSWNTSRI